MDTTYRYHWQGEYGSGISDKCYNEAELGHAMRTAIMYGEVIITRIEACDGVNCTVIHQP